MKGKEWHVHEARCRKDTHDLRDGQQWTANSSAPPRLAKDTAMRPLIALSLVASLSALASLDLAVAQYPSTASSGYLSRLPSPQAPLGSGLVTEWPRSTSYPALPPATPHVGVSPQPVHPYPFQSVTSSPGYSVQPVSMPIGHHPHVWHGHEAPPKVDFGAKDCWGGCCPPRVGCYAGVSALVMDRDWENNLWLSYDLFDVCNRVLDSRDADSSYAGGFGAYVGHYFNCGQNAVELGYWGIFPDSEAATVCAYQTTGGLGTMLRFDGLSYDPGTGPELVNDAFNNACVHRVQRDWEVHNVELNLLGFNYCSPCSRWRMGWLAGVRYLRFTEDFLYSTDPVDYVFTGDPNEMHYGIEVENNLIGFQVGGRLERCCGRAWSVYADTRVGVFGNYIEQSSSVYGANGPAYVSDPTNPFYGCPVCVSSDKDDVSLVGELILGLDWRVTCHWSVGVGYRVMGVSGVALATNQVPVDHIALLHSLESVDSNGDLILHGGFLKVEYAR